MDQLRHLHWALACLLATAISALPPGPAWSQAQPGASSRLADEPRRTSDRPQPSYFIILNAPADFDALLQKIRQPDLVVLPVEHGATTRDGAGAPADRVATGEPIVESVKVRGRVHGDNAILKVELAIVTATDDPTWVPIRLDDQRLVGAREGARALDLRTADAGRWRVELVGRGTHRVEVDLRSPLMTRPARAALSLAIPEAQSTSLELDFDRRETDLIIGANEVYPQSDLPDGRGARLSAHLTPRSRVEVSWAVDTEASGRNPPLLTAQGDIAIDIDSEQMRTRSSWVIRCVRGLARTLEVRIGEQDELTELRLDDQQTEARIDGVHATRRLVIPMAEPLRPGGEKRLLLKTRRSYARGAERRIAFEGFPIIHAREQSGAIGVTQSANLWVAQTSSQGLRRILPTSLPQELRERPSTSLAFEFLDQPFSLDLDVEASPPLVRSRSRTLFHIDGDRVRSDVTIELQWVRGRLFEVKLDLGPGLEVVSVGPTAVVEAWNPTSPSFSASTGSTPRGLMIRLAPPVRDQNRIALQLQGYQRLSREGPVKLGLFAPDETTAVGASFVVAGDRSLSVDLDDDSAGAGEAVFRVQEPATDRSASPANGEPVAPALAVEGLGSPRTLPVRIARHARTLRQETVVSAEISRGSIDLLQKTTFTVRHGTLGVLEIRVPHAIADDWQLLEREVVDREELGRDADGSRHHRLIFDRPVMDRTTLAFRCRLPISPLLDAAGPRELALPWISFPGAATGPVRVELKPTPGVVLRASDPAWTRSAADGRADPNGEFAGLSYTEGSAGSGRPFRFRAQGLESVHLPALLVSRELIRSSHGFDDSVRYRAWYWLEAHGSVFPFELPDHAKLLAARVGGRLADRVDFETARAGYRLRLPANPAARPVLVELEYQRPGAAAGSPWKAPRLPDDAVVLQTLWEARLPWDRALLGVPPGWSDDNEWAWAGPLFVRRPARDGTALSDWLLGEGAPAAAVEDLRESTLDDSHHLLFSRLGPPVDVSVRIVSRAWLVAACSGVTLILGFIAIFARIRFLTAWAIAAGLGVLAAALLAPSITVQLAQSSLIGAALTALGLVIQRLHDRRRPPVLPAREPGSSTGQPIGDSSLDRAATVGSDDSTAIRVRTPSTMDYLPSPLAGSGEVEEARSSTFGRA